MTEESVKRLAEMAGISEKAARAALRVEGADAERLMPTFGALTPMEHDIVRRLGDIASDMSQFVIGTAPSRPGDVNEMCMHVHALQNMVLAQAAARAYPGHYRALGESLRREDES